MNPAQKNPAQPGVIQPGVIQPGVALSGWTTLELGGPADRFLDAATEPELTGAVAAADRAGEPLLVLGGGSNLVVADEGFAGTAVHVAVRGVGTHAGDGPAVTVTAAAGESWDGFVRHCVAAELSGLECLSGIPGLVGATPIQNVGAYGQEVAETVTAVRVWDRRRCTVVGLPAAACGFGYRTSGFKRSPGRFVVLNVSFALTPSPLSSPIRYAELAARLGVAPGERVPLAAARAAVLDLRRGKGMVVDPADPDSRSAGSFFTNPVVGPGQLAAIERIARGRFGPGVTVPHFPAPDGQVKLPAAWLIERSGFAKGYRASGAAISAKHTLALVNPGGGSTKGLLALASEIRGGVRATFGITLEPEPVLVGVTL